MAAKLRALNPPAPRRPAPRRGTHGGVGRLSPKLRRKVGELVTEIPALVEDVVRAVRREVPEYGAIRDRALWAGFAASVEENATLWYEALLSGRAPDPQALGRMAACARDSVGRQMPLHALLHALRIGAEGFWERMLDAARPDPEIQLEILFGLSWYAFAHSNLVSETVTQAYMSELNHRARSRDRAAHELASLVLAGGGDEEGFRAGARALGLDPLGSACAVALATQRPSNSAGPPDPLELARLAAEALALGSEQVVEAEHQGHSILWIPAPPGDPGTWEREAMTPAIRGLIEAESPASGAGRAVLAGVGTPGAGLGGWRRSAEQARRALEVGGALRPQESVHRYSDLALYDVALRTPEVSEFLHTVVERLLAEPELLESAETYFRSGRHLKAAAAALHVHRNTLGYRMRRIERLLKGSFADPGWCLRLELALKLRELGGRPAPAGRPAHPARTPHAPLPARKASPRRG